jgi:hypothetical protein
MVMHGMRPRQLLEWEKKSDGSHPIIQLLWLGLGIYTLSIALRMTELANTGLGIYT